MRNHYPTLCVLTLITGSCYASVYLCNSNVITKTFSFVDVFCMGLSDFDMVHFKSTKLWTVIILQNIPQLVIRYVLKCIVFLAFFCVFFCTHTQTKYFKKNRVESIFVHKKGVSWFVSYDNVQTCLLCVYCLFSSVFVCFRLFFGTFCCV